MPKVDLNHPYGWFPEGDYFDYLRESGFSITLCDDDNMYDGYAHFIVTHHETKDNFELRANRWDGKTYKPLVEWANNRA